MTIWLYCICRNESIIMPYLLRHYERFVDKMIFVDDQSNDGTRDIIRAHPKCELRDWPGSHGMVDDEFLDFANSYWKEARGKADWVIWIDADEFLYHPEMGPLLGHYLASRVEVPRIIGFTMMHDRLPTTDGQIYDEIRTGFPDSIWSKCVIFQPHINMTWTMGRHGIDMYRFEPTTSPGVDLKLLHYRCLGMSYLANRHSRNWQRVPEKCRNRNLGTNCDPEFKGAYGIEWFGQMQKIKWPEVI